jgi:bisphosphoglycerate-dependent phosphoglycerate mutase
MNFIGKYPIHCNTIILHYFIKHCHICYEVNYGVENKMFQYQGVHMKIKKTLKRQLSTKTKYKYYKITVVPVLSSGSKILIKKHQNISKILVTEISSF